MLSPLVDCLLGGRAMLCLDIVKDIAARCNTVIVYWEGEQCCLPSPLVHCLLGGRAMLSAVSTGSFHSNGF